MRETDDNQRLRPKKSFARAARSDLTMKLRMFIRAKCRGYFLMTAAAVFPSLAFRKLLSASHFFLCDFCTFHASRSGFSYDRVNGVKKGGDENA